MSTGTGGSSGPRPFVAASDLAEAAFCPRAQWYRHHPPDAPPARGAARSARAGAAYHARELTALARREGRPLTGPLLLLAIGVLLLASLLLTGAL